jgi:hypothetical protein
LGKKGKQSEITKGKKESQEIVTDEWKMGNQCEIMGIDEKIKWNSRE